MKNHIFIYIIFVLITFSCTEEIDWQEETMPEMLVVEGAFTNELNIHRLRLSKSAPYFSNEPTPLVSNANVMITDGENIITFMENPNEPGLYETIDSVAGETGKNYKLNIELLEPINGTMHYSATGSIIQGIFLDSIKTVLYENPFYLPNSDMDSLITVFLAFGADPVDIHNYYEFKIYRNDTLVNDTIDEASIVDDKEGMEGVTIHSLFFFFQFNEGEKIDFEIQSVDEQYLDFVTGVKNITEQSSDPFNMSGPPANAIGNIIGEEGNEAIGFFKFAYTSRATSFAELDYFDIE